ncbi:MAG: aminotransferase class V-fold PLP-dependent enzyme [Bryobacteraceae bacterium]|nr:aminotransferase class V-fold PLP-dependent enzyme [Bryobacterales bacterium]MEB2362720.1 aminotransferase class V-fold PLP-dependent enzyme [Bryobacterales bacterium]NUN02170.1 aminotransferase class V-fold PLP-dependent enzyme [Bryobacteraceae bacterium]
MNRRQFFATAAATGPAASSATSSGSRDFSTVRADFPRARTAAYLDNASCHPLSVHTAAALHRYIDWASKEVGEPWWPDWAQARTEAKTLFAKLINAKPSEIAFARSTIEAESNLLNGMAIQASGGNVVTNDLHYSAAIYNYRMRQKDGLEVRIVKHRDWQIDIRDMERAVDRNTRLIAIALVSNVNGYLHDVSKLSELAHANGAYLYADIIQCAGAIPIDVRAMGIDLAACSTYKWLMGVKGFGFLYVREDLQGSVVRPVQHSGGVRFNYAPWVEQPDTGLDEIAFSPVTGPSCYEVSYPSYEGAICALESLKYIHRLGVENIRAHVRALTTRLQKEMPAAGYPSITPPDNESPIVAFAAKDPQRAMEKLRKAGVHAAMRFRNKMRISPSVFNNQEDVDRLLEALA